MAKRGRQDRMNRASREGLFLEILPSASRSAEVRSSVVRHACRESEIDDLKQELLLAVWVAIQSYDSKRASLRTFAESVVEKRLASIIRGVRAKKRVRKDMPLEDIEAGYSVVMTFQLQVDMERLLEKLKAPDKCLLLGLVETGPAQVARRNGTSRATVYRAIQRLRALLVDGGYK